MKSSSLNSSDNSQMKTYHPRARNYCKSVVIEVLRQVHFDAPTSLGIEANLLADHMRKMSGLDGVSESAMLEYEISEGMVISILNELIAEQLVKREENIQRWEEGFWIFKESRELKRSFFRLTDKGLEAAKSAVVPPRPHLNVTGDVHVDRVEHVSVEGDAYIENVQKMVKADEDLQRLISELRSANFQSMSLLKDQVYQTLQENATLRKKVDDRGWSLLEFAIAIAKIIKLAL